MGLFGINGLLRLVIIFDQLSGCYSISHSFRVLLASQDARLSVEGGLAQRVSLDCAGGGKAGQSHLHCL